MTLQDPIIGRKLGDYTIKELLGRGGMARVYRGYDEALDRFAAVKVITSDFVATADEAEYKQRFLREARAIARLHHPNIVGIYQFGEDNGLYYMAMVFLDGADMRIKLKEHADQDKRMPFDVIVKMARDVATALDYAHKQGVIHRDIKPSNIMMTTTGSVLTDFGLALSTQEGTMGDTFGSAHYIAPEQAISSARAVPQSDLYSLGVVLYEAFAGKVPFDDPSVMSVALKHLNEPPPPPSLYNPELPLGVEKVLFKVLSKEPKDRYQTGQELADALEKALSSPSGDDTAEMHVAAFSGSRQQPANALEAYRNAISQSIQENTTPDPIPSLSMRPPEQEAPPAIVQTDSPKAEKSSRKLPLAWLGVIAWVIVGLIVAGLLLFGGDNEENGNTLSDAHKSATAEAILLAEQPTDTETASVTSTEEPSATATVESSATATIRPSNTSRPSATSTIEAVGVIDETDTLEPSATNTPQPSATRTLAATAIPTNTLSPSATRTPTSTATPFMSPEIQLRYTSGRIILENISNSPQDISGLVFEGNNKGQFTVEEWRDGLRQVSGRPEFFRERGCAQLAVDIENVMEQPCGELGIYNVWILRGNENSHFWTGDNDGFEVKLGDSVLVECSVAEDNNEETICEFAIP